MTAMLTPGTRKRCISSVNVKPSKPWRLGTCAASIRAIMLAASVDWAAAVAHVRIERATTCAATPRNGRIVIVSSRVWRKQGTGLGRLRQRDGLNCRVLRAVLTGTGNHQCLQGKWRSMSERNVHPLAALFHDQAVFVTWGRRYPGARSST